MFVAGLQLGGDYIDVDAEIDCGIDQHSRDQDARLEFPYENHSYGESFVILAILQVEKRWAKVKIAYSSIVSARFRIRTRPHHEATTLHGITALQASLPA